MGQPVDPSTLDTLFHEARTFSHWASRDIADDTLERLYALVRMGPTSANCSPGRFIFVRSPEAKARLKPCLMDGNVDQTMSAPVTVIIGHDSRFYDRLPDLYPHTDARAWFADDPTVAAETAFRNGTLQGAYLIMAARALGLDCGPMSGFDKAAVEAAFFPDGQVQANFLCNLGHGDPRGLHPRSPRLDFGEACQIA